MDSIAQFFDRFSPCYDTSAFQQSRGTQFLSELEVAFVMRHCPAAKGERVLDMGIGTGRLASLCAERGAVVDGIDVSEGMLARARQRLGEGAAQLQVADIGQALPYPDETFDYVLCIRVLKYVPQWEVTLGEAARVLKRGGIFILELGNARSVARLGLGRANYSLFHVGDVERALGRDLTIVDRGAGTRLPFPLYRRADRGLPLGVLVSLERLMSWALPAGTFARNVLIAARKE